MMVCTQCGRGFPGYTHICPVVVIQLPVVIHFPVYGHSVPIKRSAP